MRCFTSVSFHVCVHETRRFGASQPHWCQSNLVFIGCRTVDYPLPNSPVCVRWFWRFRPSKRRIFSQLQFWASEQARLGGNCVIFVVLPNWNIPLSSSEMCDSSLVTRILICVPVVFVCLWGCSIWLEHYAPEFKESHLIGIEKICTILWNTQVEQSQKLCVILLSLAESRRKLMLFGSNHLQTFHFWLKCLTNFIPFTEKAVEYLHDKNPDDYLCVVVAKRVYLHIVCGFVAWSCLHIPYFMINVFWKCVLCP